MLRTELPTIPLSNQQLVFGGASCDMCFRNYQPRHFYVYRVFTKHAARGQGHARNLMKKVTAIADYYNFPVRLQVGKFGANPSLTNEQLVKFYASCGFVPCPTFEYTHEMEYTPNGRQPISV